MASLKNLHLYVGGWPLESIGGWGDPEIVHGPHGPLEMTWGMALSARERPHPLVRNALVELYDGPLLVWAGVLAQPDWTNAEFAAVGMARLADGAECLTSSRAVTSKPNTAIDQAIARQVVPWYRGADFGNTAIAGADGGSGVDDPTPGKLNELLDKRDLEDTTGAGWYVAPSGLLTKRTADLTTPKWFVLPGIAQLGAADDDVTDAVFLRYFDSTAGQYRTASYPAVTPPGGIERRGDITAQGPMTAARATNIAEGMWRKLLGGRLGFTNGIEVSTRQLIDAGGHWANLAQVLGGDVIQVQDTPDPRGPDYGGGIGLDFNFELEETRWRPADDLLQLNPVGLVARTWEQVLEEAHARGDS